MLVLHCVFVCVCVRALHEPSQKNNDYRNCTSKIELETLSRGLPTLWSHMCVINDALSIIYDAQWCTVWLWQFWRFGRFLKGKNMVWTTFLGHFIIWMTHNDAQCVIVHHLWHTVHHQWHTVCHCAMIMLTVLYRERLQSIVMCIAILNPFLCF